MQGTVGDVYVTVADEVVGAGIGKFPTAGKRLGDLLVWDRDSKMIFIDSCCATKVMTQRSSGFWRNRDICQFGNRGAAY